MIISTLEDSNYNVKYISGDREMAVEKNGTRIFIYFNHIFTNLSVGITGNSVSLLKTIIDKVNSEFKIVSMRAEDDNYKDAVCRDLRNSLSRCGVDTTDFSQVSISKEKWLVKATVNINRVFPEVQNIDYSDKVVIKVQRKLTTYEICLKHLGAIPMVQEFLEGFEMEYLSEQL